MKQFTLADFLHLYKKENPFEIVHGQQVPLKLPVAGQAEAANNLLMALFPYEPVQGQVFFRLPYLLIGESGYIHTARVPYLSFVTAARWEAYKAQTPDWRDKPLMLAPDLAVEVPFEDDLTQKIESYLQDGVRLIWVINFHQHTITVFQPNQPIVLLSDRDTLTGRDIIPDFEIAVEKILE